MSMKDFTRHDNNGKSTIRNKETVFSELVFADFNYLLSGKQSLTDVDGQFEYNGNLFIIESKEHLNSVNAGQLISLFNTALAVWKTNKISQVTYRISTGKKNDEGEALFNYVVFGSTQFEQYENNEEVKPYYITNKTNDWLARRLKAFEEQCNKNWEAEVKIKNSQLFKVVGEIKKTLKEVY